MYAYTRLAWVMSLPPEDWNIASNSGKWHFQTALRELHFTYLNRVFFHVFVLPDDTDPDVNRIQVEWPGHRP